MDDHRAWLPILGALLGVAAVLGSAAALADALEGDRAYELAPQPRGRAPEVTGWNVSSPAFSDELPVYRLEPASGSPREAVRLAEELDLEPQGLTYDVSRGIHIVEAASGTVHVSDRGRELSFQRASTAADAFAEPPQLPSDEEARSLARAFLERTGLMPPAEDVAPEPRVVIDERAGRCSSDGGDDCRHVNLSKSVRYDRLLSGRATIGANSLNVGLGDGGQIRELSIHWEPIRRIDADETVPFEDALEEAKAPQDRWWRAPGSCERAVVTEAKLGYFFPDREVVEAPDSSQGPWVFPVYLFEGPCVDQEGEPVAGERLRLAVPAVR